MGNRENRFRVLAVILSVLFFCAGIVLTLGIFLPVAGFTASHYALFAMGQRVFSVYGFSSFLIPLATILGIIIDLQILYSFSFIISYKIYFLLKIFKFLILN